MRREPLMNLGLSDLWLLTRPPRNPTPIEFLAVVRRVVAGLDSADQVADALDAVRAEIDAVRESGSRP